MIETAEWVIWAEGLTHAYPAPLRPGRSVRRSSATADAEGTTRPAGGRPVRPYALDGLSFGVRPGEIFGVLGPNGGGKTTLFRILSTLLRPTGGRVTMFGYDVHTQPCQVRQRLGVVFQMPSLDVKLNARENLVHQGHLYGLRGGQLQGRIDRALDHMGLGERADEHVESFSGGMRRRLELAKALLHEPPLLLLDEPSTGLDVRVRRDLWNYLGRLRDQQAVTIAVTTHLMDEADRCDRLAVVNQGRLVAIDTPGNLKARIGGHVLTVEPLHEPARQLADDVAERFGPWDEGGRPVTIDGRIFLERPDGPAFVATLAGAFPGRIRSITVGQPTLEDVFLHLTGTTF